MENRIVRFNSYSSDYVSKSKRRLVRFVLLVIFILCYIYKCPDSLDLGRYYEDAAHWSSDRSLLSILQHYYHTEFNFIYQTTLVFFDRSFLGASFLTGLVVATYYWFLIKNYYNNKYVGRQELYLLGLMGFAPFIYVLAIARTACAVVIFYFGVENYLNNKRKKAYLFFLAAVFTHVISGMFIGVFFVALLLHRIFSKKSTFLFNLLCLLLPPLAWMVSSILLPSIMSSDALYGVFSDYNRFETYLGDNYTSFSMKSYALADSAMMNCYLICGYILLNLTKHFSLKRCLFFSFFVALCFAGGSNFILLERFMVASSLFYALLFSELITLSGKKEISISSIKYDIMQFICILCALSFLLTLFLARRDFL